MKQRLGVVMQGAVARSLHHHPGAVQQIPVQHNKPSAQQIPVQRSQVLKFEMGSKQSGLLTWHTAETLIPQP